MVKIIKLIKQLCLQKIRKLGKQCGKTEPNCGAISFKGRFFLSNSRSYPTKLCHTELFLKKKYRKINFTLAISTSAEQTEKILSNGMPSSFQQHRIKKNSHTNTKRVPKTGPKKVLSLNRIRWMSDFWGTNFV